jgi:hypothetical protein
MPNTLRLRLLLQLAVSAFIVFAASPVVGTTSPEGELGTLLKLYDVEPDGPAKEALAARIDGAAHQKYASVSRLYWHTDLASAMAEARRLKRPILHLRLLGRLDEELSCANSRLFRTTLYANAAVSQFLRENFVLSWSTERPVPRVTIDFGDGRTIERTTTGNSVHYVLDDRGNVLDVLPGLYAPSVFVRELQGSVNLAARTRNVSDDERTAFVNDYHLRLAADADGEWRRFAAAFPSAAVNQRLTPSTGDSELLAAQRMTITKMSIELRDLRRMGQILSPDVLPEDQIETWTKAGQMLYGTDRTGHLLDDTSRSLVVRLYNALPDALQDHREHTDAMLGRLEQTILADTALNQLKLRPRISREIARRRGFTTFAALNDWIYAEVFHTSKGDTWLGLLPRDTFTGLPGDGVIVRKPAALR